MNLSIPTNRSRKTNPIFISDRVKPRHVSSYRPATTLSNWCWAMPSIIRSTHRSFQIKLASGSSRIGLVAVLFLDSNRLVKSCAFLGCAFTSRRIANSTRPCRPGPSLTSRPGERPRADRMVWLLPVLAPNGHAGAGGRCLHLRVKRTCRASPDTSIFDPQRTLWSPAEKLGGQTLLTSSVKRN